MKKYVTERQAQWPSKRDQLNVLKKRGALTPKAEAEWISLETKAQKCDMLLKKIEERGHEDWSILMDISLQILKPVQCDFMLTTKTGSYFFQFYDNRKAEQLDIIAEAQQIYTGYTYFFEQNKVRLNLHGFAVVPSSMAKDVAFDPKSNIRVISEQKIDDILLEIEADEIEQKEAPIDSQEIMYWLNEIDNRSPYSSYYLDESDLQIFDDMNCGKCGNFDIKREEEYIICPCGMKEHIESATLRSINDFTTIYDYKDLDPYELHDLFWKTLSFEELREILDKHYRPIIYSRHRIK